MPTSKKAAPRSKSVFSTMVLLLIMLLVVAGLGAAVYLASVSQDVRQQAASCSEAPINVEFRKYTGKDTAWMPGTQFEAKIGDQIDVNCFSKNGGALLTNGKLSGTVKTTAGETKTLKLSGIDPRQARRIAITDGGTYTFTCTNGSSCSNSDTFKVAGNGIPKPTASPRPTRTPKPTREPRPTPDPVPTPNPACSKADMNGDCKVDLRDYSVFLLEFKQAFNATQ